MPPDHARAGQDFVPVFRVDFTRRLALVGVAEHELVGGETDVPIGVFGDQGVVDDLVVRRSHDVGRLAQFRNHAGHFGAAPGFPEDVHAGMSGFELFFHFRERHGQAARVKDDDFPADIFGLGRGDQTDDEKGEQKGDENVNFHGVTPDINFRNLT